MRSASTRSVTGARRRLPSWLLWTLLALSPLVTAAMVGAGLAVATGDPVATLSDEPWGPPPPLTDVGPAPLFVLENLREGGPSVSLADLRGRPTIVNVWASWCVPCRREMPILAALHEEVGDRVAFAGVNHQDERAAALAFVEETEVGYPSGFDPEGTVSRDYAMFGIPTTVFISPDGWILEQRTGEMDRAELEAAISRLFGVDVGAVDEGER